jgi:hypothetical protein
MCSKLIKGSAGSDTRTEQANIYSWKNGTIYITSMYDTNTDKTTRDVANQDRDANIVGHNDHRRQAYQEIVSEFEYHDKVRLKQIMTTSEPSCFLGV